jgi:GYF domain 2
MKLRFLRRQAILATFAVSWVLSAPHSDIANAATIDFQPDPQPAPPGQDWVSTVVLATLVCGVVLLMLWQLWLYFSSASRERLNQAQGSNGYIKSNYRPSGGSNMDLLRAQKANKVGWIAGVIKGVGTICLVLYSTCIGRVQGVGFESLVDVAIVLGLSFGIYKRSRTCAVGLVAYQLLVVIIYWAQGIRLNLGFVAPLLVCFIYGMRGTFAYHRIIGQQGATSWENSPPVNEADSPKGVPPAVEAALPAIPMTTTPRSETTPVHANFISCGDDKYFILQNDEPEGPYSVEELRALWNSGVVTSETFYCEEGYEEWLRLENIASQLESSAPAATPPPLAERGHAERQRPSLPTPLSSPPPASIPSGKTLMQKRKLILVLGVVAFLACGIFPPWVYVMNNEGLHSQTDAGYGLILTPPAPRDRPDLPFVSEPLYSSQVDMSRLGIEWACICALSAAAWFLVPKSTCADGF